MTTPPAAIELVPVRSAGQIATVVALAREIWEDHYVPLIGRPKVEYMLSRFQSAEAVARQLEEGYEYFLTQRAGKPIGYCAVQARSDPAALFVSKFYVHKDERGAGTGRVCMEFIEQLARRRGLTLLWLTVNKENPAVKAYERLGFRIATPVLMDIGGGYFMDDFRMEKTLA